MHYTRIIKKKGSFRYLFNKGSVLRRKHITVYYSFLNKKENSFGVCVSKKNGNSVSRNKLKRWVREVYTFNEEKLKKGLNIVFLVKRNITFKDLDYSTIKLEIEEMLNEGSLYENT